VLRCHFGSAGKILKIATLWPPPPRPPTRPRPSPPHFAQWEHASKQFTLALKFARGNDRETAAVLLSNRSAALCRCAGGAPQHARGRGRASR
jgi:hypothetical protein